MIRAYDEMYLDDAMKNLGEAVDYAVNVCQIAPDDFLDMFVSSGLARQFQTGSPSVVAGRSGTELVCEIAQKTNFAKNLPDVQTGYSLSREYWGGWILAYYQWTTGKSFKHIRRTVSMEEILRLYPTLHEAAEEKSLDVLNHMISRKNLPVRLKELRKAANLTQRELAEKSGVKLRNIQQYEQRVKDINQASGAKLAALSRVLGCNMEELMEEEAVP